MRMVGYGRVSTDHEEQRDSLEHQQAFFQDFARARGHTLVRVYADQGISGKWLKKRDGFLQMLRDAERGEFELVVVKDISRFARNTVDCLDYVRALRTLGIAVIFEKENINTLESDSEMLITLLGAFAQAESESISANVRWGKRRSMKAGHVTMQYKWMLGYEKGPDGRPVINEEQAETVRFIYDLSLIHI